MSRSTGTEDGMFRRIVDAGLTAKSFGDADIDGRFHLVEISEDATVRASMRESIFGNDEDEDCLTDVRRFDALEAGWYFATVWTGGSFFFYKFDDKEEADAEFASTVENYTWVDIW